jgi:hypothetical protein
MEMKVYVVMRSDKWFEPGPPIAVFTSEHSAQMFIGSHPYQDYEEFELDKEPEPDEDPSSR